MAARRGGQWSDQNGTFERDPAHVAAAEAADPRDCTTTWAVVHHGEEASQGGQGRAEVRHSGLSEQA